VLDAARYPRSIAVPVSMRARLPKAAVRLAAYVLVVACAFIAAAWVGAAPPFEGRTHDPYSETAVMRAIPFDAPLPYDIAVVGAGRGDDLPYRAQWSSQEPADTIAGQFHEHLAGSPKWQLTQETPVMSEFRTTLARVDASGYMTHFARITIERSSGQTFVTLEFTPVPSSLVPD
jgi:hypothetical protein